MIILGIESTAHTLGIGIVKDKKILSNEKSYFRSAGGGIMPREAADHHAKVSGEILKKALTSANLKITDIEGISYARSPGLGPCLKIGQIIAKTLKYKLNKPTIGVNHCITHIEIGKQTTGAKNPLILYVSGGNTQILSFKYGRYRVFGETIDIGLGNALDKFARSSGLKTAPEIEKIAKKSNNLIELPYSIKGMNVSYSGLITKCQQLLHKIPTSDICYSLQETAFAMIIEASERAMSYLNKDELICVGGVANNNRLREMLNIMCKERNATCYQVEKRYCGDNGAMIALTGELYLERGIEHQKLIIDQKERTDQIDIPWITD